MITPHPLEASDSQRASNAFRWLLMASLLVAVVVAVMFWSSHRAEASSCSGPFSDGEIRVVIVVDGADIGSGSSATCLVVPAGTTGSQLLARRSAELGTGSPRYGSSGLLCAIDGQPATGCGDRNAGGFGYWAYFAGSSGSWSYGNSNPFLKRLSDGDIEGWRYVQGAGNGQDPPPRISPLRSLFPVLVPAVAVPPESQSSSPMTGGGSRVLPSEPSVVPNSSAEEIAAIESGSLTVETSVANASAPRAEPVVVEAVALASSSSTRSTAGRWIGIVVVTVLIIVMAGGAWMQTRRSR